MNTWNWFLVSKLKSISAHRGTIWYIYRTTYKYYLCYLGKTRMVHVTWSIWFDSYAISLLAMFTFCWIKILNRNWSCSVARNCKIWLLWHNCPMVKFNNFFGFYPFGTIQAQIYVLTLVYRLYYISYKKHAACPMEPFLLAQSSYLQDVHFHQKLPSQAQHEYQHWNQVCFTGASWTTL